MVIGSSKQCVVLNAADCDLGFLIQGSGLRGSVIRATNPTEKGLADCWFGCRANVGITGGKYCFGCKVLSFIDPADLNGSKMGKYITDPWPEHKDEDIEHVCRIGISTGDSSVGSLGDEGTSSQSLVYESTGNKFGPGDTIACAVNLQDYKPNGASVSFFKNGKLLSTTMHEFNAQMGDLFPHILLKNVEVEMQFRVEHGLVLHDGFKSWESSLEDGNTAFGPHISDPKDCEVMFLVGLPYLSGKSTWAKNWVKDHPEKRYVLVGVDMALDLMKVPLELRKQKSRMRNKAYHVAGALSNSRLIKNTPRHYILDKDFSSRNNREFELRHFNLFKKIAVVAFPCIKEMKSHFLKDFDDSRSVIRRDLFRDWSARFILPRADEPFDEVMYVKLSRYESIKLLMEMKQPNSDFYSKNFEDITPYEPPSYYDDDDDDDDDVDLSKYRKSSEVLEICRRLKEERSDFQYQTLEAYKEEAHLISEIEFLKSQLANAQHTSSLEITRLAAERDQLRAENKKLHNELTDLQTGNPKM